MLSSKGKRFAALLSLYLVCACLASHFRGGIISWEPVDPANFDGRIRITHRVAWRRGTAYCDANTSPSTLLSGGNLDCRSGCSGRIGSMSFYCTDFSVSEDWTSGERTYEVNLGTSISTFEASFASCCWVGLVGSGSWEVRVKGDLSVRSDTGRVNTSPVSATQPIIRLVYNSARTITIPVQDADGDIIRCRWATSSQGECAGVCNAFSYGTLDGDACTLTYNGRSPTNRWYAVSLQIEDFATASSTTPMSSVPLQFLVNTFTGTACTNCSLPTFVDTLADGACVGVSTGSQFTQRITAQASVCNDCNPTITNIQTVSPLGFTKGALTRMPNTNKWYIDVTWTPSATQTGPQIFCYQATDSVYQSSEQRCITLLSGVAGPNAVPRSDEVSGEKDGLHEWSIRFDEHFTRPTSSAYIRIYEQGTNTLVDSIDASTSTNVVYPPPGGDTTLKFFTPTYDATKLYYVLFDQGVVVGIEQCGIASEPIDNPEQVVVKLTCPAYYVYRYTDYTQGTCRNKYPDNPMITVPSDVDPKDCSCPDGTVVDERKSQYTKWLNNASPGGTGDHEQLSDFLAMDDPPVCERPVGIECRVADTEVDYRDNGEVYNCSLDVGGICNIADQADGVCEDYEVRFLCPCGSLPYRHVEEDDEHPCSCFDPVECPACRGGAWGDPHYTSYDGLYYDLFDHCTHIFTKDCMNNTFAVYSVTSNACSGGRTPTCIDEAYVGVGPVLIHLYSSPPTYEFTGTEDLSSISTTVTLQNGQITVYVRDLDVVVTFGRWELNVQVSSDYGGKLCGLLGDCNGETHNDMYIYNSTGHFVPATLQEFEEAHRVYNFTNDGCEFIDHTSATCEVDDIDSDEVALCNMLTDVNSNSSACHMTLSPNSFHRDCLLDACYIDDNHEGLCRSMLTYADKCRSLGIDVGLPPEECVPTCPQGQVFQCGSLVTPTCQHPQGTTTRDSCVHGCFCEDGKVLDVNGECVDPADCIVCPFDHVIRFGLHPQPSCRNPEPQNQTRIHGCFCPEGSVLNDRTGRCVEQSSCPACSGSASGDPHYITYDGYRYDLFDHCSHVFTKDCDNNTFAVYSIASDRCSGGRAPTCIDSAVIEVPAHGVWIYLEPSQYTYTGVGGLEDVNIEVISGGLTTVRLIDYDVIVTYGTYFLSVRAPLSYRGKLCGLLGDCDGDLTNDFKLQNGTVVDLIAFEIEYRAPGITNICSFEPPMPAVCDNDTLSEAQTFCNSLLDPTGSYANCSAVISPMDSYDGCVLDYCFVNEDETLSTVCRVIQDYADECRFHGIEVGTLPMDCQPSCTAGKTFQCGPSIPQSCQNPDGYDDGFCVEGCYCNYGTIQDINGECVDPTECTVCPPDRVIRYGYESNPTCRNPDVPPEEEMVLGCFCPVGYLVNDLTGKCIEATSCPACTGLASGDPHYLTYDGLYYDLFDHCSHLFTGDCVNNTFAVYSITSDRCSGGRAPTCIDRAVVDIPVLGLTIHLFIEGSSPVYDFEGVPSLPSNISILQTRDRVLVHFLDYDVYVWFGWYYLKVQVPVRFGDRLCGLLGNCNGDSSDDWMLRDGSIAGSVNDLDREYRYHAYEHLCRAGFMDPMTADPELNEEAEDFCGEVTKLDGTYAVCHNFIDPDPVFDNCIIDYTYLDSELLNGPCRTILDYGDSCRQSGVEIGLAPEMCRPQCPEGQSYRCGPLRPASCEDPETIEDHACHEGCYCNEGTILDVDGRCVAPEECTVCPDDHVVRFDSWPQPTCRYRHPEINPLTRGCFCPKGMVINDRTGRCVDPELCSPCLGSAYGDPHYLSHDGLYFDLFDHCSHLFSGDCVDGTFAVYSFTSDKCSGGRAPTCVDKAVVDIPALNLRVILSLSNYEMRAINDSLERNVTGVKIANTGSQLILKVTAYDVVVTFGRWYLNVAAPLAYSGKLCGLVGNGNGNITDDWMTRNGTILFNVLDLERWYRVDLGGDLSCTHREPGVATGCSADERQKAMEFCSFLTDPTGPHAPCHPYISPNATYDSCVLDYCYSESDNYDIACQSIRSYADDCRANNFQVTGLPEECKPECLWDSEFTCGPVYPSTCADRDGEVGSIPFCVEGCFCRPGYVLDIKGDCVEPAGCALAECQYDYDVDLIFAIDTSESSGGGAFFRDILDWVAHIVHRIEFGDDKVRVGILIFGSVVLEEKSIALDKYINNKDGLVDAIKQITWKSHGTEIGTAISNLSEKFASDFGARVSSTKVGVIVTDGETHEDYPMPVSTAAQLAKEQGIILHAVGAGSALNLTVLQQIARRPEYVYWNPTDGTDLDGIFTEVSKPLLCEVQEPVYCNPSCGKGGTCVGYQRCTCTSKWTGDKCGTPVCGEGCLNGGTCTESGNCTCTANWRGNFCERGPFTSPNTQTVIIAVIDVSEDFRDRFIETINYLRNLTETQLYIGVNGTRLGVMLLGDQGTVAVGLDVTNADDLVDALQGISYDPNQNSNPAAAFIDLLAAFSPDGEFGAEEAELTMTFLFTDGDNTNNQPTLEAAMALEEAGITMQVVGVGSDDDLTPENRQGLEAIASATGGKDVLYGDFTDDATSAALRANITLAIVGPVLPCPQGQAYRCAVLAEVSCCIPVWRLSRDPNVCTQGCYCTNGKVRRANVSDKACYEESELNKFCPTTTTPPTLPPWLIAVIAVAGFFLLSICILCPVICCLMCIIRKRRNKEGHSQHLSNAVIWNLGHGRPDWEDEEKLVGIDHDDERESTFQEAREDVPLVGNDHPNIGNENGDIQGSSDDIKGLGISNPMFDNAENDEGEYTDQDMDVGDKGGEEKQSEQEKQEEPKEEEEKGEEEEKLIDFDEEVDGENEQTVEEPPTEEPAMRPLADRIRMFHGGDAQQSERERRPPPKKLKSKFKMFEAPGTSPPPTAPSVPQSDPPTAPTLPQSDPPIVPPVTQSDPPTASTLPQSDPPAIQPPEQGGQMSVEAWDKELQGILDKMN